MKFRKGFVTNSSSSSFVCDYCGNGEGGWDYGLEDAGMAECVNRHTLCQVHFKDGWDDVGEDGDKDERIYSVPAEFCPICQLEVLGIPDSLKFFEKKPEVLKQILSQFKDYNELKAFLKG